MECSILVLLSFDELNKVNRVVSNPDSFYLSYWRQLENDEYFSTQDPFLSTLWLNQHIHDSIALVVFSIEGSDFYY